MSSGTYSNCNNPMHLIIPSARPIRKQPITRYGTNESTVEYRPRQSTSPRQTGSLSTGTTAQSNTGVQTSTDTNSEKFMIITSSTTKLSTQVTSSTSTSIKWLRNASLYSWWLHPRMWTCSDWSTWPVRSKSMQVTARYSRQSTSKIHQPGHDCYSYSSNKLNGTWNNSKRYVEVRMIDLIDESSELNKHTLKSLEYSNTFTGKPKWTHMHPWSRCRRNSWGQQIRPKNSPMRSESQSS